MLFKSRFHPGIQDGSITVTHRAWSKPQAKAGGTYRLGAAGAIAVERVDHVTIASISEPDARRAGFVDKAELVGMLKASAKSRLSSRSKVYRVQFCFSATEDPRKALQRDASKAAVDEVLPRLQRMDKLSRRGPWTQAVLELIAERPKTRAPDLAASLELETRPFKTDVRKLKALGLTISHKVGYELSARGKVVLARLRS